MYDNLDSYKLFQTIAALFATGSFDDKFCERQFFTMTFVAPASPVPSITSCTYHKEVLVQTAALRSIFESKEVPDPSPGVEPRLPIRLMTLNNARLSSLPD